MDFTTPTTTHTDERGNIRTAICPSGEGGSIDIVDPDGRRICQVNLFYFPDTGNAIVDVIDVDRRYPVKAALTDPGSQKDTRGFHPLDYLVSADFRNDSSEPATA